MGRNVFRDVKEQQACVCREIKVKASYRRYLKDAWVTYLRHELESLASVSDEFVTAVVNAVGYQNTEARYQAEDQLVRILKARYQGCFSEACEQWDESERAAG